MHKPILTVLCAAALGAGSAQAATDDYWSERLERAVAAEDRPERHTARDRYRNPVETLSFCRLNEASTVVEIWPGGQGGWYRRIVSPLVEESGGTYIPVTADRNFLDREKSVPYGEVDLVLVFRAHGFMIYDKPAQNYVNAIYRMLRPGGSLCIVDHAGDESVPQDPDGENGYVNESHFRAMAERAGFELLETSDHNRNPADTKDHPRGVYSLPPTLAGTRSGTEEREQFLAIGESDRFTHRYIKPDIADASAAVWIDVRTPQENAASNISGDPLIAWDSITPEVLSRYPDKSTPIFLYCGSGGRAGHAADALRAVGYANVTNAGGIADARRERGLDAPLR